MPQSEHDARRARRARSRGRMHHQPQAEEQPQRIAPHRDDAAAAHDRAATRSATGPKASSVTMRRSNASARPVAARGSARAAQIAAARSAAMAAAKPTCADQEPAACRTWSSRPRERRGARLRIGERQEIVLHQPDQMRRHDHERDRGRDIGPGRRERRARVAIDSTNSASGAASTTTKYFAHSAMPSANPSSASAPCGRGAAPP